MAYPHAGFQEPGASLVQSSVLTAGAQLLGRVVLCKLSPSASFAPLLRSTGSQTHATHMQSWGQ